MVPTYRVFPVDFEPRRYETPRDPLASGIPEPRLFPEPQTMSKGTPVLRGFGTVRRHAGPRESMWRFLDNRLRWAGDAPRSMSRELDARGAVPERRGIAPECNERDVPSSRIDTLAARRARRTLERCPERPVCVGVLAMRSREPGFGPAVAPPPRVDARTSLYRFGPPARRKRHEAVASGAVHRLAAGGADPGAVAGQLLTVRGDPSRALRRSRATPARIRSLKSSGDPAIIEA